MLSPGRRMSQVHTSILLKGPRRSASARSGACILFEWPLFTLHLIVQGKKLFELLLLLSIYLVKIC